MNIAEKTRKPRAGLFLVASPRFKKLGAGTSSGTYEERKINDTQHFIQSLGEDLEVCFPGIIYGNEDTQRAIQHFAREDVDFILAVFLSWSEDFAWIRFLRDTFDLPILYYSPVKDRYPYVNTADENDFVEFLAAGGLVGACVGSGSIPRLDRKVKVVVGKLSEVKDKFTQFGLAAKTKNVLRKSRFGLLANYNELMWGTYIDPYQIFSKLGPELNFIPYSQLEEETQAVSDSRATEYMQQLKATYAVKSDVEESKFMESARASMGMANIVTGMEIDTLALNDVDSHLFKIIGLRPGFYHPSIGANHSVAVPEGDLGAALITYILKLITKDHVNFIEPFYIEGYSGCFTAGHAGPNDYTATGYEKYVRIAVDVRFANTSYKYAGAPFAWYRIPPGKKTIAHFSECNGSYKIVCFLAESLEGEHFLNSYSHSLFRPYMPVNELFERVLSVGTTQHFAAVAGDCCTELREFAQMCGFEFHHIA